VSPEQVQIPMEDADHDLCQRLDTFASILDDVQTWAKTHRRDILQRPGDAQQTMTLAGPEIRRIRQRAVTARCAAGRRLCIGLFGPSRAGKSFLIGEMGRAGEAELTIANPEPGNPPVPFLKHINPCRGDESTGVVCRFTLHPQVRPERPGTFVARLLLRADILKCLATGFLSECRPPDTVDAVKRVKDLFDNLPTKNAADLTDPFLCDLDDAWRYMEKHFEKPEYFGQILKHGSIRSRIECVDADRLSESQRRELASTLWGMGSTPVIDRLYTEMVDGLARMGNAPFVEIEQDAVVSYKPRDDASDADTIPDVQILPDVLKGERGDTTVCFNRNGQPASAIIRRALLSALVAELYLPVTRTTPNGAEDLLPKADVLDFPGARAPRGAGEGLGENALQDDGAGRMNVVDVLRRGKLSYLFEHYCGEREISVLVFCVDVSENIECHQVGAQVRRWIETRYPRFDHLDEEEMEAPSLFLCPTKFDKMLDPHLGVGAAARWNQYIRKLLYLFEPSQGAEQNGGVPESGGRRGYRWMTRWGNQSQRPFKNIFWVRNPEHSKSTSSLDELRETFIDSALVRQHMDDPEARWDAVAPVGPDDREHTGLSLLVPAVLRKLRPDIKREELAAELAKLCEELAAALRREYISLDEDVRGEEAKREARRLLRVLHEYEMQYVFGPLLERLSLPPSVVGRVLDQTDAVAQPDVQIEKFVENLVGAWLHHASKCVEEDRLGRLAQNGYSTLLAGLINQLAQKAQQQAFKDELAKSVRAFFEHNRGFRCFEKALISICCRKWCDFVASLGQHLPPPATPSLPPSLTRDVAWRRFMDHWDRRLEEFYMANSSGEQEIPPGNAELGDILDRLEQITVAAGDNT